MPTKDGPVGVLERVLRSLGPPSLGHLIARMESVEEYEEFLNMVKEYLPESELEIMGLPLPSDQMGEYCKLFSARYFPLWEYDWEEDESYAFLTRGIPVIVMGIGEDEYHCIPQDYRLGYQLMTYMVRFADWRDQVDEGARVALADAFVNSVPAELLQRVPEGGYRPTDVQVLLEDTKYKALIHHAKVLSQSTGTDLLDLSEEDYSQMEPPPWEREMVDSLTIEWRWAMLCQQETNLMCLWLEEDPPVRFEEILNFIDKRKGEVNELASQEM